MISRAWSPPWARGARRASLSRASLWSEASLERRNARLPCARKGRPHAENAGEPGASGPRRLAYSFVTMWLAAARAGVTRQNAEGKEILILGAAGGLGTLALQTLSEWGARVTAIAKASDLPACLEAGAAKTVERERNSFANLRGAFDATLNFATWEGEANLLSCLREGALGHATTVHPLVQSFDERGWIGGALRTIQQKRKMRAALPGRTRNYAWVLFRPEREALSEVARLVELGRLSLPIGIRAPLRDAAKAFDHMQRHAPGRALFIP